MPFDQVDQILAMRGELVEATEKVRRLEAEKEQLDTDISSLKQQVRRRLEGGCGLRHLSCNC